MEEKDKTWTKNPMIHSSNLESSWAPVDKIHNARHFDPHDRGVHVFGYLGLKILKIFICMPCEIRFKNNNLHICQDELKWDQMTYHIPAVEQTDCHVLAWGHLFFFKNTSFSGMSSFDESDLPFLGLHFTIWFSGWKHARVISSTGSAWES